jgi:hypothetical protein
VWLFGSYTLSILVKVLSKKSKFEWSGVVFAPLFWPLVIFSAALALIFIDTVNGLMRMYKSPLAFLFFAITQVVVVIPAMPDALPVFILYSPTIPINIFWSPIWQYTAVVFFGISLALFHWQRSRIMVYEIREQGLRMKFLHAVPLLLLVFSGIFLGDLLISQALVSIGSFFLIAAGVLVSMALDELTKKNPRFGDLFRGLVTVFRRII